MIRATVDIDFGPLDELTKRATNSGMTGAVRKGINRALKPARAAVVSGAERGKRFGFLSKSIGNKVKLYPKNKSFVAMIGPKRKFKRKGKAPKNQKASVKDRLTGKLFSLLGKKRKKRKPQRPDIYPARYAHLIEFGSKRSKKRPFIKPVMDAHTEQFFKSVVLEVQKELIAASAKLKK